MLVGFLGHLLCYDDCYILIFYHAADVVDVGANTTMSYMGLRIRCVCCSKDQGGKVLSCMSDASWLVPVVVVDRLLRCFKNSKSCMPGAKFLFFS